MKIKSVFLAAILATVLCIGGNLLAYSLYIQANPSFITSISPPVGQHTVYGVVDISASGFSQCPDVYKFDHWEGDIDDPNSASTTVFMNTDKTATAVFTLATPVCGDECHPNFTTGDLNHDCIVDLGDFAILASRWMNCTKPECDELPPSADNQPPLPNPAQWATSPYSSGTGTVSMTAVTAIDAEGNGVEYYFECVNDSSLSSGWITIPTYTVSGLSAGQIYVFRVKYRDTSNNYNNTDYSTSRAVTVDDDCNPPMPNPAQWATPPYQSGTNSIAMTAVEAIDVEGHGVQYYFQCLENGMYDSGWISSTTYTLSGLSAGQTYTFRVKYRDMSNNCNNTAYSASAAVTISEADIDPPVPNPTTLTAQWWMQGSQWYHILTAAPVTDESGFVEYQFQCVDVQGLVDATWWNAQNTVGLFNPNGTPRVPNSIWVPVSSGFMNHAYRVRTRDLYQNTGQWSIAVSSQ